MPTESLLDDPRYQERRRLDRRRSSTTVLEEPKLFPRVFPELDQADHARLAALYAAQATVLDSMAREAAAAAKDVYGAGTWPARVRQQIGQMDAGKDELLRAARAHEAAAGKVDKGHPKHATPGTPCHHCKEPITGQAVSFHADGKTSKHYHAHHAKHHGA
jgi:hypothetical protein